MKLSFLIVQNPN